ncbi:hypothetical protein QJS10_CPB12g00692 [Acorus calamus]|uniref:Uncharacterized protein n=1 Tax=Acorus calamus TaxID=4465 RepID=A0AAV9DRX4_ACOCL|nr:hypothetical protein QJS10_CPB12g00692 [Acorus calamus]
MINRSKYGLDSDFLELKMGAFSMSPCYLGLCLIKKLVPSHHVCLLPRSRWSASRL